MSVPAIPVTNDEIEVTKPRRRSESGLARILKPVASLKFTVVLLFLGVFMTWVASLQQTQADIWEIKRQHFYSPIVMVSLDTFFVPAWTPQLHQFTSREVFGDKIRLPLPSGVLIMSLMMLNLLAAHTVRFRVKGKGPQLFSGLAVFGLGGLLTAMVVINGQNAKGFQAEPVFSWQQLWLAVQVGLAAVCVSAVLGGLYLGKDRRTEKVLLFVLAAILGLVVIFLLIKGESAFIGESAMRIMWQLIQGGVASVVMLVGCIFIFGRKCGIVLLHLGLILLMLGEFFVTYTAVEQRMFMYEGDVVSHTYDIRDFELAIISPGEEEGTENVTAVPGQRMLRSLPTKRNERGKVIHDDSLPFALRPLMYMRNSRLKALDIDNGEVFLATQGVGTAYRAVEEQFNTGTSSKQVADYGAMYVELINQETHKPIGTFLLSQVAYEQDRNKLDEVTVNGKTYRIGLRFKHYYKPYTITLKETNRTNYPGTNVPLDYYSKFQVIHPEQNLNVEKKTWMNNPVRYGNETFYQAGHDYDEQGRVYSVLQVVRNTGWMIPYICCMMVGIGLLAQFGQTLLKFLRKDPYHAARAFAGGFLGFLGIPMIYSDIESSPGGEPLTATPVKRSWAMPIMVLVIWALIAIVFVSLSRPKNIEKDSMRLDLLGQVPIAHGGRVQPLDSLAKNIVKNVTKGGSLVDQLDEKRKPIRWFADFVFDPKVGEEYYFFKIMEPEVQQALNLPRRKGHRYTFAEVEAQEKNIEEIIFRQESDEQPDKESDENSQFSSLYVKREQAPELLTNFESKILEIADTLSLCMNVRLAFGNTVVSEAFDSKLDSLALAKQLGESGNVPLIVGAGSTPATWKTLEASLTNHWLLDESESMEIDDVDQLAAHIVNQHLEDNVREALEHRQIVLFLCQQPGMLDAFNKQFPDKDESEMPEWVSQQLKKDQEASNEILDDVKQTIKPTIDRLLNSQRAQLNVPVAKLIRDILGLESDATDLSPARKSSDQAVVLLAGLSKYYRDKNSAQFNLNLKSYLEIVYGNPPKDYSAGRLQAESWMNRAGPFYFPMLLYLCAFVLSMVGWIKFRRQFSSVAFALVFAGLLIQTLGLIMRIYVSGRPPVTTLHSTALFISWGLVILCLVGERFLRNGIGNLLAGLFGYVILLIAMNLAVEEMDTIGVLRAVLDTSFWLATHVTIISLGYSSTLVAGSFGMAYIIGGILSPSLNSDRRKEISRIIYGITCFSLFCSFVGTVLGGLWADDSWGRFWGWDVKENGALMIVLCNAILLHARWAGLVKDRGMAVLSLFSNVVVVWSWFAVNELGVGLHSYGFTEGKMFWVGLFWISQFILMAVGAFWPRHLWISHAFDNRNHPQ